MGDTLTILRCAPNLVMAKTWQADGTIRPYDNAKHFSVETAEINSIDDLGALLLRLEGDPQACIIRGTPKPATSRKNTRRILENFRDDPLHSMMIEVDDFKPLLSDPVHEPLDAALEYITECLPSVFNDVSFVYQLSNSAGKPGNEHLLKMHIWFFSTTPYDSATLKAWVKSENLQLDTSVFNPVQIHYTSSPIFEPGAVDPITQRSGFRRGNA